MQRGHVPQVCTILVVFPRKIDWAWQNLFSALQYDDEFTVEDCQNATVNRNATTKYKLLLDKRAALPNNQRWLGHIDVVCGVRNPRVQSLVERVSSKHFWSNTFRAGRVTSSYP